MNHFQLTKVIEESPHLIEKWLELLSSEQMKNDRLSKESLGIIIRGLRCLKQLFGEINHDRISVIRPVLAKLASSYNSPRLFKEAGKIYLLDFRLTETAREHLKHALTIGCEDSELPSLLEAAHTFSAFKGPSIGVTQNAHTNPSAGTILRKTGRLSLVQKPSTEDSQATVRQTGSILLDPKTRLDSAQKAIAINDWTAAQLFLSDVSATEENNEMLWDAWTQLAEGLFEAKRFKAAEAAYRAACLIDPYSLISQFNWGVGLQMIHRYQEALEAYQRADLLQPNHPKVWCNIGSVHFLMENYGEAEAAMLKTVALKKDYARAWDNLAAAFGAQEKMEEAETACNCALIYRPDFPEVQFKLGIIYYSQKRYEKALNSLGLAATHPDLNSYTNAYISMTFSEMGSLIHAERTVRLATQSERAIPEVVGMAWRTLGRVYINQMEYRKAISALEEACGVEASNSQNWLELGLAHQFSNESAEASHCFSQVVKLDEIASLG